MKTRKGYLGLLLALGFIIHHWPVKRILILAACLASLGSSFNLVFADPPAATAYPVFTTGSNYLGGSYTISGSGASLTATNGYVGSSGSASTAGTANNGPSGAFGSAAYQPSSAFLPSSGTLPINTQTSGTLPGIRVSGTVPYATNATNATTAANGGVTSVNGTSGAVTVSGGTPPGGQLFDSSDALEIDLGARQFFFGNGSTAIDLTGTQNSAASLSFDGGGGVYTPLNTLDDGAGNVSFAGAITAAGLTGFDYFNDSTTGAVTLLSGISYITNNSVALNKLPTVNYPTFIGVTGTISSNQTEVGGIGAWQNALAMQPALFSTSGTYYNSSSVGDGWGRLLGQIILTGTNSGQMFYGGTNISARYFTGVPFVIKNQGTQSWSLSFLHNGIITSSGSASSITINPGDAFELMSDGTNYDVYGARAPQIIHTALVSGSATIFNPNISGSNCVIQNNSSPYQPSITTSGTTAFITGTAGATDSVTLIIYPQ